MAILGLSDPSGSFECIVFSEQIAQFGEFLEQGKSAVLEVEADQRPDGVSLRLLRAQPISDAAEKLGRQLTVFAENPNCLPAISSQLKPGGEGAVSFVIIRDGGAREYEVSLPGNFRLTPEIAGGIKSLDGVMDVRLN